jgi:hypothetical protein
MLFATDEHTAATSLDLRRRNVGTAVADCFTTRGVDVSRPPHAMLRTAARWAFGYHTPIMIFSKETKGKFTGTKRLRKMWKAYAGLSVAEKQRLKKTAIATKATKAQIAEKAARKARNRSKKRTSVLQAMSVKCKTPDPAFVKANDARVAHMSQGKRKIAMAGLWRKHCWNELPAWKCR